MSFLRKVKVCSLLDRSRNAILHEDLGVRSSMDVSEKMRTTFRENSRGQIPKSVLECEGIGRISVVRPLRGGKITFEIEQANCLIPGRVEEDK